ncbi:MAG TPA: GNAT family N-acetyltransferase [Methanocorpusculum sp.]|nr:GNAT family N-acetyltransferase [Methanocorpusculum sp.]
MASSLKQCDLSEDVNLSGFDCGIDDLNDFIQNDALKNQNDLVSVTKLLYQDTTLIGYFTITLGAIQKERVALSDKVDRYPYRVYPAIKLARLAVDKRYHKHGFGSELLYRFMIEAMNIVKIGSGRFISVDARAEAVGFYEKFGFVPAIIKGNGEIVPLYLDISRYYNSEKT